LNFKYSFLPKNDINPIPAGGGGGQFDPPPVVFLHNSKKYWSEALEIF